MHSFGRRSNNHFARESKLILPTIKVVYISNIKRNIKVKLFYRHLEEPV